MKTTLGLYVMKPIELAEFGELVHDAMLAHADVFDDPNPTMPALAGLASVVRDKSTAVAMAEKTLETARLELKRAVKDLRAGLTREGAYVDYRAGGDASIVALAGMKSRAARASAGPLSEVLNVVLTEGAKEGTLRATWKPVRGARSYEVQFNADSSPAESSWAFKMTAGKASAVLEGLTSGARVWVRVRAVGARNRVGPWSNPAVKTVP